MENTTSHIKFFALKLNQLYSQFTEVDERLGIRHSSRKEGPEAPCALALNAPIWWGPTPGPCGPEESSFPLGGLHRLVPAHADNLCEEAIP